MGIHCNEKRRFMVKQNSLSGFKFKVSKLLCKRKVSFYVLTSGILQAFVFGSAMP